MGAGQAFTGSNLIKADTDLIATGLLLDLKTSPKLSLGIPDMLQLTGMRYSTSTMRIRSPRSVFLVVPVTLTLSRGSCVPCSAIWLSVRRSMSGLRAKSSRASLLGQRDWAS